MKKLILTLFFSTAFLFAQESKFELKEGIPLPNFDLKTLDGKSISLNSLKGKPVFINLWFSACKPCIEEMPELNKMANKYKDKVTFLGITFDDNKTVAKFLKKHPFEFVHLVEAKAYLFQTLQNTDYPQNIIIDKNGRISATYGSLPFTRDSKTGKMKPFSFSFFEAGIKKALQQ